MPTVTKHPNKQIYSKCRYSITLTCKSDGNPKPIYHWYKDNHDDNISTAENFTLRKHKYKQMKRIYILVMSAIPSMALPTQRRCFNGGQYFKRRKTSETLLQSESESFDVSESKSNAESMTGNTDFIAMENGTNKTQTVNNGHEVVREHNEENLRTQKEGEQKERIVRIPINSSLQPAVYADMNEATKLQNKQQNTETMELAVKQHEGSTVESQEGINDEAGDRSHIENEDDEHLDTSNISSQQNRNSYTELSNQTSQTGCYNTQASEEDENRKVATVSPTIHSSDICQDNEQTNQNCHSQSKEGYENIIDKDQSDTLEDDNSHRTAL
ncbi:unnamed protein product [Mytilus edulis]|uniref:Ig-like domain-containing protein n=1 Tax=Mytilus edulis TaxID=6550 RepID=A0A8S3Q1D1_MYTED|nr:unnamed protein product [Mytilus edulis]